MGNPQVIETPDTLRLLARCRRRLLRRRFFAAATHGFGAASAAWIAGTVLDRAFAVEAPWRAGFAAAVGLLVAALGHARARRAPTADPVRAVFPDADVDVFSAALAAQGRFAALVRERAETAARALLATPWPNDPRPVFARECAAMVLLAVVVALVPAPEPPRDLRTTTVRGAVDGLSAGTVSALGDDDLKARLDAVRRRPTDLEAVRRAAEAARRVESELGLGGLLDALDADADWRAATGAGADAARRRSAAGRIAALPPEAKARLAELLRRKAAELPTPHAEKVDAAAAALAGGASDAAAIDVLARDLATWAKARGEVRDLAVTLRNAVGRGSVDARPAEPGATGSSGDVGVGERRGTIDGPDAGLVRRYFELRDAR